MRKIFVLILLVIFGKIAENQDTTYFNNGKNNLEIELNYLSASAYYSRFISNHFSFSFGGGIGSSLNFILIDYEGYPSVLGDFMFMRIGSSFEPIKYLSFSLGIQASFALFGENEICEECGTIYMGLPISISYGYKFLRIGTRIIPCHLKVSNTDPHFNLLFNPIFIRIVI